MPVPPEAGLPPFSLTVPAPYDGVVVNFDGDLSSGGTALSVQLAGFGPTRESVWPGGTSAVSGDEFYIYPMLPRWLTNDAGPIQFRSVDIAGSAATEIKLIP